MSDMNAPRRSEVVVLTTGHGTLDDRVYYKEALSLSERYLRVTLMAQGETGRPSGLSAPVGWSGLRPGGGWKRRLGRVAQATVRLVKLSPKVCHFHDPEFLLAVPLLRALVPDCVLIYDSHEVYPDSIAASPALPRALRGLLARAFQTLERRMAEHLDGIVVPVHTVAARFVEQAVPVVTVFNYPRSEIFGRGKRPEPPGGSAGTRDVVLYQGSISIDRGLAVMLEAMRILRPRRASAQLHLVGPATEEAATLIREFVATHSLEDSVVYRSAIPHTEIPALLGRARIGLVPFNDTPAMKKCLPIKQFEYMASGLPVVGADLPLIAPYLLEARAGMVYEAGSASGLASAIETMLVDPEEWARMSAAGEAAVRRQWTWESTARDLIGLYERIAPDLEMVEGRRMASSTRPAVNGVG